MLLRLSAILGLSILSNGLGETGPVFVTSAGFYVGVHDAQNQVDVFKGIRFASPPARFTPATPLSNPSAGAQSAAAFGSDCPQLPTILGAAGIPAGPPLKGANQSEDCLFVNVWRPEGTSVNDALPILVYIHGGGYFAGSGSEWDGTSLVRRSVATKKPIIWITFNYRIGVLGFLGSVQAPLEALNVGLQDQRDALRWIQDNAHAFGGDSSRITISGESAGASSVHMHYLYPDSRRTFRAGISSSGTSLVSNTPACEWHDRPGGAYDILGNVTGCGTGTGSFECLRTLPFDVSWKACVSGSLIDEYPTQKVINGDFLNAPIITGTNRNEGNYVVGTAFIDITPQPPIELENSILSSFIAGQATNNKNVSQDTLATLLDLYANPTDNLSNSSLSNRASQFLTDYMMLAPERLFLKTASATQREQDVWVYSFEQPLAGAPDFFGAFHTSDLYYLDIGFPPVASLALQSQMQDFYISFVNDLDPGVAQWPKYDERSPVSLQLKEGRIGPIADTLRREQTDFLSQVNVLEEFGRFG
ncbi:alpha/beta-hydrolase [Mycena albidolilacea]|uniref:Carboxylic ester hydrolase n=1 Tax=Mycena albidolilacea TaxID=1033008 RepID=A0AAD6Z319_9AGAR|nr:alpha/beta-hydrolase [Mycena albidolilacea]